ncbi:hypothetical protein OGAPHI_000405 [Ogataea philodendri]|uniref:Uncharacterized protein n=1 Tax=Ogataea philodendri TaxID=1378263 RepID=A0A9P8PHF9_9ASCO|nr:uncharacterized protein OGAPHI_000405 [Ogataea philodendri]KAH3671700.1 hypothetical protein OGAPHI_000405 [Ogataea philodendri]
MFCRSMNDSSEDDFAGLKSPNGFPGIRILFANKSSLKLDSYLLPNFSNSRLLNESGKSAMNSAVVCPSKLILNLCSALSSKVTC